MIEDKGLMFPMLCLAFKSYNFTKDQMKNLFTSKSLVWDEELYNYYNEESFESKVEQNLKPVEVTKAIVDEVVVEKPKQEQQVSVDFSSFF